MLKLHIAPMWHIDCGRCKEKTRREVPYEFKEPRILLVEDDQLSREALAYILRLEGFGVETAENGRDALELLHRIPHPSIVLLDLGLPIVNGQEFLRRQKRDPEVADIPVVVITAMPEAPAPEAMAILPKPLELPRLMFLLSGYRDSEGSH